MSMHLGDNVPSVKRRNRALILELILRNGPIPRVTLSEITGLSRAAVSTITGELIDAEVIYETGDTHEGKRSVGRAPVFLDINADIGGVVAVEVTSETVQGAFLNLKSEIKQEYSCTISDVSKIDLVLSRVTECINHLIKGAQADKKRIMGIGISFSGLIDPFSGMLISSTSMGWKKVNLAEALRNEANIPIVIDSNVRAMVLAEHLFGAGRGVSNMALIYMGTGIGCGIILNDEVYAGSANKAGEIGHTTVVGAEGKLCSCGSTGCLETMASGRAIAAWASAAIQAGGKSIITDMVAGDCRRINADVVARAAAIGDSLAQEAFAHAAPYLALAIANLINCYDPRLVVLAGHVTAVSDTMLQTIRGVVEERAISGSIPPEITMSKFGLKVGVVGAGALALRELVYSPRFDLLGDLRSDNGKDLLPQRTLRLTINRG